MTSDRKPKARQIDMTTGRIEWGTPQRLFDELNREFNFTLDVCATPEGQGIGMWLKKAAQSHATVVCLVPSRTDNYWWQRWVMTANEIRFLRGRLKFAGAKGGAQYPSAIVIFRNANHASEVRGMGRDPEEREP